MKKILSISCALLSLLSFNTFAAPPQCYPHEGGAYCQYTGTVSRLYVNKHNWILLYFDVPISSIEEISFTGFDATKRGAAITIVDDNPEFSKMLYSTLLSAQATGRKVTVQMRGAKSGYLVMDRVWLSEP